MSEPACLIVCGGKACRKSKGYAKVLAAASRLAGSQQASCQGLCKGPVVAVQHGAEVRWFAKVRSKPLRRDLLALVLGGSKPGKHLAARESTKRRDIVRARARLVPLEDHDRQD